MTHPVLDVNEDIPARYHEKLGRGFKIVAVNPHGHWAVLHAGNSTKVNNIPGYFTDINSAIKAIDNLPEDQLPVLRKNKVVLTPKKIEDDEELE